MTAEQFLHEYRQMLKRPEGRNILPVPGHGFVMSLKLREVPMELVPDLMGVAKAEGWYAEVNESIPGEPVLMLKMNATRADKLPMIAQASA